MNDTKQRIDMAKWLFERTLGWIATADVKVGVAMALDTALLGGLAAAYAASEPQARTGWCYLAALCAAGAMALAVLCAGMAAIPRMLGPVRSMIFFARIADQSSEDYVLRFSQLTDQELLDDLAIQIHRNAEIAAAKHWWVRRSLMWSFFGVIPWMAAISMLVKV